MDVEFTQLAPHTHNIHLQLIKVVDELQMNVDVGAYDVVNI